MKRSLKRLLRRQARKQTREAIRALERAGKGGQDERKEAGRERASGEVDAGTRVTDGTDVNPDSELKNVLQSMDDYDFEYFVADLWERMGWETEVSTQSSDRGIDVVATRNSPYEETALIQAKRYGPNTTVGSPDIQQYASLKHQRHGVDKVLVVTTNGFSGQAQELAHQLNVKLVDGDDLVGLVEQLDATELVERYVPAIREPEPEPDPGAKPNPELDRGSEADVRTESSIPEPGSLDEPTGDVSIEGPVADRGSTAGTGTAAREDEGPLASRLPGERWQWVAATTALWPIAAMLGGADGGLSMLIAWVGLPYAILKDATWTRWRRWYAVAAAVLPVFAMFVGGWYLLMRWRTVGLGSAAGETEGSEPMERREQRAAWSNSPIGRGDYADSYDHYTEAVDDVKRLKRERRHDEAESLLRWCIESAERQAREQGYETVPPWYYEHLAIVYRKSGRYDDEVAVLERYVERGGEKSELLDRLDRARDLAR